MDKTKITSLFSLEGKGALVTGGGLVATAIADLFIAAGATVMRAVPEGHANGPIDPKITVPVDLSEPASVRAVFDEAEKRLPRLDILVNGAVLVGAYPLSEISVELWDRMHDVNIRGAFLLAKEAVRLMTKTPGGGRIIHLSTIGALHPVLRGNVSYGASRSGANGMFRALAYDCARDGILVNSILVGAVAADPWPADARPPSGPGTDPNHLLLGMGQPEDVAPTALLLASAAGRYITGQSIGVEGGFLIA